MSMYLPNDDVGPTGAEGAEFIDVPEPAEPDEERADESGSEESAARPSND